jgi:hypothetical protein
MVAKIHILFFTNVQQKTLLTKFYLFIAMAIILPASARGQTWERVVHDGAGEIESIDISSIKLTGEGYVRAWTLRDFAGSKPFQGKTYMSTKTLTDYDCKADRIRILAFHAFTKPSGSGEAASGAAPQSWEFVVPGSMAGIRHQFVCSHLKILTR